jgi:hypothetical protein
MEIGIFMPSSGYRRPHVENDGGDDFNDLPDASKRRGNPFWTFLQPVLGLPAERYPAPSELDWQIDAVARRDEKMRALNLPPTRGDVVAGIVGDVVDAVRRVTKTDKARAWLAERLQQGPVDATVIEAEGRKLGYPLKLLKIVKKRLKVVSVRKGANFWRWRLPTVKESKADDA